MIWVRVVRVFLPRGLDIGMPQSISQEIPLGWVAWWISGKKADVMIYYSLDHTMADSIKYDLHACHTNLTGQDKPSGCDDDTPSQCDKTHLRVWFCDVRAACAIGWAGSGQGRAWYVKHVFGGRSMRMVAVLKTHLGAGWHDPSGGGRGRQASDIYRAGEQQWVRPTIASIKW